MVGGCDGGAGADAGVDDVVDEALVVSMSCCIRASMAVCPPRSALATSPRPVMSNVSLADWVASIAMLGPAAGGIALPSPEPDGAADDGGGWSNPVAGAASATWGRRAARGTAAAVCSPASAAVRPGVESTLG